MEPRDNFARGFSIASLAIAVLAIVISFWQAHLQQKSYDRTAGKIRASIKIVSAHPDNAKFNNVTLGNMININPQIRVRNTGDEAIEALRVEVRFIGGVNDIFSSNATKSGQSGPLVLKQCSRKDYELSGTLSPGAFATLPLNPPLLEQMMLSSNRQAGDKVHRGIFEIRCLGRLVGLNHFDPSDSNVQLSIVTSWIPNDFPLADVQKYTEAFQPYVAIE